MAWRIATDAPPGSYLMVEAISGFDVDVFATVTPNEVLERVRAAAQGWTPSLVQFERGIVGVGSTLRVFGQAQTAIPMAAVTNQVSAAINSFWTIFGVEFAGYINESLEIPQTSGESIFSTVSWMFTAMVIIAAIILVIQLRKATS